MTEFITASSIYPSKLTGKTVTSPVAESTSHVSPWLSPILYFLGRYLVLPCFFRRIHVIGQENIPRTGPVILAPTHRSRWDSLVLPYATGRFITGRDMRFMVTSSECNGIQGWFVSQMGGFAVNQKHPAIATLRHAVNLMLQKEMLVIYPEGGIFQDGNVHPLKQGVARIALSAEHNHPDLGIKVIPITINYSQPCPTWGADVMIQIGEPIQVSDYNSGHLKLDAKRLTADITHQLQQLNSKSSIMFRQFSVTEFPNSRLQTEKP
ncbi:1-acyl-sn-glycerol-3-phosphate acyltransferase [Richelia sinica FACHB-800]|nr:1-acyl-sn-glycerol-3-phosphate acyltransferase [Richelia sinica]MBD2664761.1 1-acyl-sn-glycerol-3-phosphate acyltransferase [Richelia sinica FACHB-800]